MASKYTYNDYYINEYSHKEYTDILSNPSLLNKLGEDYLKKYSSESSADRIAFKESLDHYVYKRLIKDPLFIDSDLFKNYWNYYQNIMNKNKFIVNEKIIMYSELMSSLIMRDDTIRTRVFKKYCSLDVEKNCKKHYLNDYNAYKTIIKSMSEMKVISQEQVDFVAQYIYESKVGDSKTADIFLKYVLNNVNPNIKSNARIFGALGTILTSKFSLDEKVRKGSRFYITNYDNSQKLRVAHSSGIHRYVVFEKDLIDKIDLNSAESLLKSRTSTTFDMYWVIMVTFHELTHQHQRNDMLDGKTTPSGLAYAINKLILTFNKTVIDGNKVTDYQCNHDTDEIEMQADEQGWIETRKIIHEYLNDEKYYLITPSGEKLSKWGLCFERIKEISARRSFSRKVSVFEKYKNSLDSNYEPKRQYYATYDIERVCEIFKQNPDRLSKYPYFKQFFKMNGDLDAVKVLSMNFEENPEEDSIVRNSEHQPGLEFQMYAFENCWNDVLNAINNNRINYNDIQKISSSIYHTVHRSILCMRRFDGVKKEDPNFKTYDETRHKFDFEQEEQELKVEFFDKIIEGIIRYSDFASRTHPKYDESKAMIPYYIYEGFLKIPNKNDTRVIESLRKLNYSDNDDLINIYNDIYKNNYENEATKKAR